MDVKLIADKYPSLKLRNKTGRIVKIAYEGGDSLDLQPNGVRTIQTAGLIQLPDATAVQFLTPSRAEIRAAVAEAEEELETAPAEPEDTDGNGTENGNGGGEPNEDDDEVEDDQQ